MIIYDETWRMWEHKLTQGPSASPALYRPKHHHHHKSLRYILVYKYIDAVLVQNPLHACRSVESKLWSPLKWRTSCGGKYFCFLLSSSSDDGEIQSQWQCWRWQRGIVRAQWFWNRGQVGLRLSRIRPIAISNWGGLGCCWSWWWWWSLVMITIFHIFCPKSENCKSLSFFSIF